MRRRRDQRHSDGDRGHGGSRGQQRARLENELVAIRLAAREGATPDRRGHRRLLLRGRVARRGGPSTTAAVPRRRWGAHRHHPRRSRAARQARPLWRRGGIGRKNGIERRCLAQQRAEVGLAKAGSNRVGGPLDGPRRERRREAPVVKAEPQQLVLQVTAGPFRGHPLVREPARKRWRPRWRPRPGSAKHRGGRASISIIDLTTSSYGRN